MVVVGRLSEWLKSQKGISVPMEWLEACVEWIHSEHQGSQLRDDHLKSMVYEQWLVCDLRELEAACLPRNLNSQPRVQLNDVYNLQVDSIVDVGAPFFGQLQKIKGADDTNINVTEATQVKQWEPKPSRMLMLSVTDGCQNVKVMEYRPIQCLHTSLSPGVKIQISGGVLCRKGILMATSNNVQVLGGEVDSLVEKNTQEKVLCGALAESKLLSANPPAPKKWTSDSTSHSTNSQKPPNSFPRSSVQRTFNVPPSAKPVSNHNVPQPNQSWNIQASPVRTVKSRPVFTAEPIVLKSKPSTVGKQPEMIDEFDDDFDVDQLDALDNPWDDDVDDSVLAEHFEFQEDSFHPPESKIQPPASISISPEKPLSSKPLFKTSPKALDSIKSPVAKVAASQIRRREFSGDNQPENKKPLLSLATPIKSIIKKEHVPLPARSPSVHFADDLEPIGCQQRLPYSYLSTFVKSMPATGTTIRVKAFVSTLLSKLESNKGSHWSLTVLLNDGSASLQVDLSNEIMKRKSRGDPSLNEVLKNALKGCQQKLIKLSSIVEVESRGESLRPKVMRQIPITEEIISQLKKRTSCKL